jgi:hypothetical protein
MLAGPKEENRGEENKGSSSVSSSIQKKQKQSKLFVFFGFCQDLQYLTAGNAIPTQIKKLLLFTLFFSLAWVQFVAQLDQKNIEKNEVL